MLQVNISGLTNQSTNISPCRDGPRFYQFHDKLLSWREKIVGALVISRLRPPILGIYAPSDSDTHASDGSLESTITVRLATGRNGVKRCTHFLFALNIPTNARGLSVLQTNNCSLWDRWIKIPGLPRLNLQVNCWNNSVVVQPDRTDVLSLCSHGCSHKKRGAQESQNDWHQFAFSKSLICH